MESESLLACASTRVAEATLQSFVSFLVPAKVLSRNSTCPLSWLLAFAACSLSSHLLRGVVMIPELVTDTCGAIWAKHNQHHLSMAPCGSAPLPCHWGTRQNQAIAFPQPMLGDCGCLPGQLAPCFCLLNGLQTYSANAAGLSIMARLQPGGWGRAARH